MKSLKNKTKAHLIEEVKVLRNRVEKLEKSESNLRQAEQSLKLHALQQVCLAGLGKQALSGTDSKSLVNDALKRIQMCLNVEYSKVLKLLPQKSHFLLEAGRGWKKGLVGSEIVSAGKETQAGFTLLTNEPVIVENFNREKRFNIPKLLSDHNVISGMSVIIGTVEEPYGILGAHTSSHRKFSKDDVNFFQSVANFLAEAIKSEQAEKKLRESEKKYRLLVDNTDTGFVVVDDKGIVVEANDPYLRLIGAEQPDDVIGHSVLEWTAPESRDENATAVARCATQGYVKDFETTYLRADGTRIVVLINAIMHETSTGKRLSAQCRNITGRKKAEEEIRKLSHSVEQSPAAIFITDLNGKIEYVNPKFVELTGYASDEAIGKHIRILKSGTTPPEVYKELWSTISSGSEWRGEFKNRKKSGEYYWGLVSISGIKNAQGEITNFMAVKEDFTERKKVQEALQESEAMWRSLTENSPDHVMLLDRNAKVLFINKSVSNLTKDEIIGQSVYKFILPDYHKAAQECFEKVLQNGQTESYETRFYTNTEDAQYYSMRVGPVYKSEEIAALVSSSTNITEQKKIEKRLRESHDRLRSLAGRLQMIREEERAIVARAIHDDLGQALTAIKMDLSWLKKNTTIDNETLTDKYDKMLDLTNSSIQTVKRIVTELRPVILDDLGLLPAIEWQKDEFQNRSNIQCNLSINRKDIMLNNEISIAVFRIFQETLTNIARHSKATKIDINLDFQDDGVFIMEIKDDGVGIKKEQVESPESFGLISMRERIKLLKGEMEISGVHEKGTLVKASIPYAQVKEIV